MEGFPQCFPSHQQILSLIRVFPMPCSHSHHQLPPSSSPAATMPVFLVSMFSLFLSLSDEPQLLLMQLLLLQLLQLQLLQLPQLLFPQLP